MKNIISKKTKTFLIIKYIMFFILFYVLSKAGINNYIFPFYFGVYFALVWCNQSVLVLSPIYVLARFLSGFLLYDLYGAIFMVVATIIIYGVHQKLKKPIKEIMFLPYALVAISCDVFFKIYLGANIIFQIIELVVGLLFMFATMKFFEVIIVRGIRGKMTSLELICGGSVVVAIFCGLSAFSFWNFELAKLFAFFVTLFFAYAFDAKTTLFMCTVMGLGTLVYSNNAYFFAPIVLWGLVCVCFRTRYRIIMVVASLLAEVVMGIYFDLYYSYSIMAVLPCIISALLFLALPKRLYAFSQDYYNSTFGSLTMQNIINRNREIMQKRLTKLSGIFAEMNNVFRSMIKGKVAISELKLLMQTEIKSALCIDCPERNRCHRIYEQETSAIIENLCDIAFEKGKITLIDIPSVLTSRCFKINQLVYKINDLIAQYKNYAGLVNSIDASRVLIAEQLYGVSGVMKNLAKEMGQTIDFDRGLEKRIIDELTYNNIICSDALVYGSNGNSVLATLAVRKEDYLKASISKIVSKICGSEMSVCEDENCERAGWKILNLKTAPKYDVVFGTSAITKASSQISGDCYSIIRIENDKILMALCDGMGSGQKAENCSRIAISLVENFYKAGFENELVLPCVNKFLSLGKEDVFSCLDMAVIDLTQGVCDLIKLGATVGHIKHENTTEQIECSALPLGIISTAEPNCIKKVLQSGDMVVLSTDGVNDSFASDEDYANFINNINSLNPQEVADQILQKALENDGGVARDDMTVVVAKVFSR